MPIANKALFNFNNQQRLQHTSAYFRLKLLWSRFGYKLIKDFENTPGQQVDIPIFGKLTSAEKPNESEKLVIDGLGDTSFSATVFEAAKAYAVTDSARVRMGARQEEWENEAAHQTGRVLAELVDADALAVLNNDGTGDALGGTVGNQKKGHDEIDNIPATITLATAFGSDKGKNLSSFTTHKANIRSLTKNLNRGFGDRDSEVMYSVMHSQSYTDIITDTVSGFLKADANSPFSGINGYEGMLNGKNTFKIDNVPKGKDVTITDSAGVSQKYVTRKQFFLKPDAYALLLKQQAQAEQARDTLKREDIYTMTQWYGFVTLHKQISSDDIRAVGTLYLTEEETA